MSKSINVYWSCVENEWMRAEAPIPVSTLFYKDKKYDENYPDINMHFCPAFNEHLTNLFAVKSIYEYEFGIDSNGNVGSSYYDQAFFDRHVNIKSVEKKLFSFNQSFMFFTDEESLPVTMSLPPYYEDNNITKRCIVMPGLLDIGKWYRNTDLSFYLKDGYDSFKIEEGEVYSYFHFHTDKKINFIPYRMTRKLTDLLFDCILSKEHKQKKLNITKYYSMFRTKKLILKEIKENLLDH